MTCTLAGALRRNFKSSACSEGRSLPTRVKVLPVLCTFAPPPSPFSEMASSMRPLYSAVLGLMALSGLLGAAFSGEGSADFTSATVSRDRKSTRLNSSHGYISYAVFCLKKKKNKHIHLTHCTTDPQPPLGPFTSPHHRIPISLTHAPQVLDQDVPTHFQRIALHRTRSTL